MKIVAILFSSLMLVSSLAGCESEDERRIKEANKFSQANAEAIRAKLKEGREALHSSPAEKRQ